MMRTTLDQVVTQKAEKKSQAKNNSHAGIKIAADVLIRGLGSGEGLLPQLAGARLQQFLAVLHHDLQIVHELLKRDAMAVSHPGFVWHKCFVTWKLYRPFPPRKWGIPPSRQLQSCRS